MRPSRQRKRLCSDHFLVACSTPGCKPVMGHLAALLQPSLQSSSVGYSGMQPSHDSAKGIVCQRVQVLLGGWQGERGGGPLCLRSLPVLRLDFPEGPRIWPVAAPGEPARRGPGQGCVCGGGAWQHRQGCTDRDNPGTAEIAAAAGAARNSLCHPPCVLTAAKLWQGCAASPGAASPVWLGVFLAASRRRPGECAP